jgi:hypothetical protein
MYTAKIKNKVLEFGILTVYVEFTDGTNVVVEWCKPQDEDGLKYWVKSRLAQLNSSQVIDGKFNIDDEIDVADPVVTPPVLTQAQIDEAEWLKDYRKWVAVKKNLIDTNVLTGNETQVVALLNKVKTNFKPAYLDKI